MNIIKDKPKDFMVISGDDALTYSIINLGGEGVISVVANAYPSEFSSMVNYSLNKETDKARELHYKVLPAIDLMFAEGSPAGVKAFMQVMGLMENVLRLPLVPVSENLYKRIAAIV
jgi:4-hydroxy-tetrahydrodipicolinate synthase